MITRKSGKLAKAQLQGEDTNGNKYKNINEMWTRVLNNPNEESKEENWYKKQVDYWNSQEASVNGVLGGYEKVHWTDVDTSRNFLDSFKEKIKFGRVLDCGAGIGRVTKDVLINYFEKVDLVEPSPIQLDKAKEVFKGNDKVEKFYCKGLQEFDFEQKYDCVWLQWVLCYLTDEDLVKFLIKCKENLVDEQSLIVVKENVHDQGFYVDNDDNSVIRSDKLFQEIFDKAGLTPVKHIYQPGFPKDLFKISMYALKQI